LSLFLERKPTAKFYYPHNSSLQSNPAKSHRYPPQQSKTPQKPDKNRQSNTNNRLKSPKIRIILLQTGGTNRKTVTTIETDAPKEPNGPLASQKNAHCFPGDSPGEPFRGATGAGNPHYLATAGIARAALFTAGPSPENRARLKPKWPSRSLAV
jgi:hypothetical protein